MDYTTDSGSRSTTGDSVVALTSSSCITSDNGGSELLPLSPFTALRYHFGMLLGVADFETDQGYHRAKMRIHNAWLHGAGVVWGFGVSVDAAHGEIRVTPGLALDAAGHELHLETDHCVNVGKWFKEHEKDAGFNLNREKFDVHVAIRFKPCLTRQVPALLEPCENSSTGTAYSRVFETIDVLLLPGKAPAPVYPYHRLRVLFGLIVPEITQAEFDDLEAREPSLTRNELAKLLRARRDKVVLDELKTIRALPGEEQPAALMAAFHKFAALDEIDLHPATSEDGARTLLFPGQDDEPVFLANVTGLSLTEDNGNSTLSGGTVDSSVRPSHVATTTIQDLLCGARMGAEEPGPGPGTDNGPRVLPDKVFILNPQEIQFEVDKELLETSLSPSAFAVTSFEAATGWKTSDVVTHPYSGGDTKTVNLQLNLPVSGRVRLIVYGTGRTPVLGADLFPLAGAVGGPPGSIHDGHDFVYMKDFVASDDGGGEEDGEEGGDEEGGEMEQPGEPHVEGKEETKKEEAQKTRGRTRRTKTAK